AGFITALHDTYPPGSVRRSDIDFPRPALAQIARWGNALILLRGSTEAPEAGREHPERVVEQLEILATASALVHGRTAVTDQGLALVAHVACSSGVGARGRVLQALLACNGEATTRMIVDRTRLSTKTALNDMEELAEVGLATFPPGAGREPARIA